MGLLDNTHARRAAILMCVLAWLMPAASAGSLQVSDSLALPREVAEPFGLPVSPIYWGGLVTKWQGVVRKLDDERVQLALCDGDRGRCASEAALQFLAFVDTARLREGRTRLDEINRAINLAIQPMSDLDQFGEIDVWSSPLVTLYHGAGDCEDYAIAKLVALRMAGIPADDLRIVVLADVVSGEGHAVAAARLDGHWLILDNRHMALVEDVAVRNYRPLFVIDQSGVKRYSHLPLLVNRRGHDAAPATAQDPARPRLIAVAN